MVAGNRPTYGIAHCAGGVWGGVELGGGAGSTRDVTGYKSPPAVYLTGVRLPQRKLQTVAKRPDSWHIRFGYPIAQLSVPSSCRIGGKAADLEHHHSGPAALPACSDARS
ncbi:hypothetical protein SBA4_830047 [Candidatus Sulfopaludibacter sp. SbA4]|nr:hypothetical protein SBA4_830047 [Candidatus Sulfopaludibacter sp. SbA4]